MTGVAFFVLLVSSSIIRQGPPSDYASGATVISFFKAHQGAEKVSSLLEGLAVVFLLLFASWLRTHLRGRGAGALASAAFGGAVVVAVGGATRGGIGWALASGHDKLDPGAAQTLNVLFASHYPAVVGIAVFMLATGAAILRTAALPRSLGWAALPIGLIAIAPPTLIPLIAMGVWILVASVLVYVRGSQAD